MPRWSNNRNDHPVLGLSVSDRTANLLVPAIARKSRRDRRGWRIWNKAGQRRCCGHGGQQHHKLEARQPKLELDTSAY
ncbi:hypothetical protein PG985_007811 [Apiospora marii]|uniref:uncharacterized protein n=1 Tax=Apiospora marii TaxID=335849 RepID=UPI003131F82F